MMMIRIILLKRRSNINLIKENNTTNLSKHTGRLTSTTPIRCIFLKTLPLYFKKSTKPIVLNKMYNNMRINGNI